MDHWRPRSWFPEDKKWEADALPNLWPACCDCNAEKSDRVDGENYLLERESQNRPVNTAVLRTIFAPKFRNGFWTVLEECVGKNVPPPAPSVSMSITDIEFYFKSNSAWGRRLPSFWVDLVLAPHARPTDFGWNVKRQGERLVFNPIASAP